MVRHKTNKHIAHIQGRHKKPKGTGTIITILIVILIILATGYISNWTYFIDSNNNQETIASVNGEPILTNEFETQWEALPVQAKMQMDRVQLLDQMISETLLLQEAKKQNIMILDEEVDQFINMQLTQTGITFEQYKELLETQGTTLEEMQLIYKKQLSVAKLFDETVNTKITPSIEEITEYYKENKDQYFRQEQVTVKHILIQVSDNFNDTQAIERVKLIEKMLDAKNNTNFCDMTTNYSMDFGSKDTCGEYTFPRESMVPEFENASFEMTNNERRVVKTDFGYHIILKVKDIPAEYMELDETLTEYPNQPQVKDLINQTLTQSNAKEIFDSYVLDLYKNADIEYFDIELTPTEAMSLKN